MQSAYHPIDTYTTPQRAQLMVEAIMRFSVLAEQLIESGGLINELRQSPIVPRISRMKDIPNEEFEQRVKELINDMETGLIPQKGGVR